MPSAVPMMRVMPLSQNKGQTPQGSVPLLAGGGRDINIFIRESLSPALTKIMMSRNEGSIRELSSNIQSWKTQYNPGEKTILAGKISQAANRVRTMDRDLSKQLNDMAYDLYNSCSSCAWTPSKKAHQAITQELKIAFDNQRQNTAQVTRTDRQVVNEVFQNVFGFKKNDRQAINNLETQSPF